MDICEKCKDVCQWAPCNLRISSINKYLRSENILSTPISIYYMRGCGGVNLPSNDRECDSQFSMKFPAILIEIKHVKYSIICVTLLLCKEDDVMNYVYDKEGGAPIYIHVYCLKHMFRAALTDQLEGLLVYVKGTPLLDGPTQKIVWDIDYISTRLN